MTPPVPGTVLVIDDDPLMRELLTMLLQVEGIAVHSAASGGEALARLAAADAMPDVVLTDLQMPDTDPASLVSDLRKASDGSVLLLGMSGSPATDEELALFDGFLLKPFSTEDFLDTVRDARQNTTNASVSNGTPSAPVAADDETAIPVLDTQVYNKMAASLKPSALAELYRITLDDVRQRSKVMQQAFACGDHETCRREAHAIKGGCGMVGAMELRAQAAALEAGAPADHSALAQLETACQQLARMLDTLPEITFGAS